MVATKWTACVLFVLGAMPGVPLPAAYGQQTATAKAREFDGARAFEHVRKLVEIGPRPVGSTALARARAYIEGELKGYGLNVSSDEFVAQTTRGGIPMKNIIARLPGNKPDVVILAGHYDTKTQPGFVGANDGGSSAAAVLEMARVLATTKPEYTIWFVFFDGEEALVEWGANNGMDNTYGSRHLAEKLAKDGSISTIRAMILFDMIGDAGLDLMKDMESTPWLVDLIWKTAHRLGYERNFLDEESGYSDDHLPFRDAGVPVVDLLDFNYGPNNSFWHTNRDTLDKISGESMRIVGTVVLSALPDLYRVLDRRTKKSNGH
jgi:Zn-dependent M28 family amino/carboxypeptidase